MTKPIFASLLLLMISIITVNGQVFSFEEKLQGYAHQDDQLHFLFDESHYQVQPYRVVVTGSFRNWSQDMVDPNWQLQRKGNGLWTLALENKDYDHIPPLTQFKYRVDNGEWLSPPEEAPNEKAGNLEYMSGFDMPTLKAELLASGQILTLVSGVERPLQASNYKLTDAKGNQIQIAEVLPRTATETILIPEKNIDIARVHFLEIPALELKTTCSFDGWFRDLYSNKPLGAEINQAGTATTFRVFAPRATGMKLYLYKQHTDQKAYEVVDMQRDKDGVWEARIAKSLKGVYYDFTVHGPKDEPGSHFYESTGTHISDPYARVNVDAIGKSRVWEATKPASPLKAGIPPIEDVIAYEVHVQDFTDQLPVDDKFKGTLPAMYKNGLRNSKGEKIGFDYLLDLGINVVHLMPVQEYLHFPDDDWQASFKDDPYMQSQGIAEENYQWGYRTTHAFAVETRFREKGTEPGTEREQFRDLVQAFHDQGIAVIIDIVPNHTGENMDGTHLNLHFNALDKLYYYRTKDFKHIGAFGNEVKTEERPMVQRWLIDQCQHYIKEFGVDGFRIDLAGQIDKQTLIKLKEAIGQDKIVYGEPWIGSNDPAYEANPDWDWYKEDSPITFFQDDSRNAFKGPVSNPTTKKESRGWVGGNFDERENVMKGLSSGFPEDKTPTSGINYLDIHDNWALADRFAKKDFDGRFGVDEDEYKMAATLLYTSLGPLVLHGGTEMMRSKGAAPLEEIVKETKAGYKIYLHGKRDTYNQRFANNFIWENVGKTSKDKGSYADYKGMYAFWRGLNRFRLSEMGKVFRVAEQPEDGYYQWLTPNNKRYLGYMVAEKVLVLLNASEEAYTFELIDLPKGKWKLIGNNQAIDHINGVKDKKAIQELRGGTPYKIELPGKGLKIWVRE
ncbi:MAG: alpha-amylase family glycosyl hydrolase [Saprospiraceae bacterium]|nr:alpha-amylase family glycosyl hydrolase [Saprospiraceae bacterium]